MNIFKGPEILKIAVHIEQNGFALYTQVARNARAVSVRDLFSFLAKEETRHRKTFELLLKKEGDYTPVESFPGEYAQYLGALAGENVFTKEKMSDVFLRQIKTDIEAVDVGITFEKDSIIFFNELRQLAPAEDQAMIDRVISEERVHFKKLADLRHRLK